MTTGRQGVPMNATQVTPAWRRRRARSRRRQEARWAARSGPVSITTTDLPASQGGATSPTEGKAPCH